MLGSHAAGGFNTSFGVEYSTNIDQLAAKTCARQAGDGFLRKLWTK
jgi:hypothetical protein